MTFSSVMYTKGGKWTFFAPSVDIAVRVEGELFFVTHALIFAVFTLKADEKYERINFMGIKLNFFDFIQF